MMRCHYEVLQVERDVSDTDLRKTYRKLALKYHPDKNPDNVEECTRMFNAIQQAYEVLSDPQERAWYDKHREEILRGAGSDFKDDSLNLMPFFSTSCFSGYGDDPRGFYMVYGGIFRRLADEEDQYREEGAEQLPVFGTSTTPYEEVHAFYGYWQSFATCKSFVWEDKYDLRQAPNRKVQRLMEKENKKRRSAVKKERNETVRQLVAFVRKRDKRVQQYREQLEEREKERKQRAEEKRTRDMRRRLKEQREASERYRAQEWEATLEQDLLNMEAKLDTEYGAGFGEDDGGYEEGEEQLFCPACNKVFKSDKALANHEMSKKHRENVALLKHLLAEEEEEMKEAKTTSQSTASESTASLSTTSHVAKSEDSQSSSSDGGSGDGDGEGVEGRGGSEGGEEGLREAAERLRVTGEGEEGGEGDGEEGEKGGEGERSSASSSVESDPESQAASTRLPKRRPQGHVDLPVAETASPEAEAEESSDDEWYSKRKVKSKAKVKGKERAASSSVKSTSQPSGVPRVSPLTCSKCGVDFSSRNKLFKHIQTSGHALPPTHQSLAEGASAHGHKGRKKKGGKKKHL